MTGWLVKVRRGGEEWWAVEAETEDEAASSWEQGERQSFLEYTPRVTWALEDDDGGLLEGLSE